MKPLLLLCLLLVSLQARIVTDDYGRQVEVPDRVDSIYAASPPLTMSVIAFDPALVAALNFPISPAQALYVGSAASRPVVGGFFGQGNTPNYEILAGVRPDVIVMWGGMRGVENALAKLEALGIPVLLVHNRSIRDLILQFRRYGDLTGNRERADALIAYTRETLGLVETLQDAIAARTPMRYYFAEGLDGLSSECRGSFHLEPFLYAGGVNALDCEMHSNFGMERITMEQVLLSDPDVIVAMEPGFIASLRDDPRWKQLRAVRTGTVLSVPSEPFNYITRPPSFMRLLGIRWLIHAFYPDLIAPLETESARFERLFFPTLHSADF